MQAQRKTLWLGHRSIKQGPHPLPRNQGSVEKSVTVLTGCTTATLERAAFCYDAQCDSLTITSLSSASIMLGLQT